MALPMMLMIPGPVQTRPETQAAMAQDIAPWDHGFRPTYARIRERVRAIAGGIAGEHVTLPLQGSGHFIMEAAMRSLVPVGAKILIPMNGAYADRMARLAREAGRAVVTLDLPNTRGARAEDIAPVVAADPAIGHVALVYSETGSGIVNDVPGIGRAVRQAGRRMLVDAVSAFGALPFNLAEHPECDALMFTSGKCLEGMPGIGFAVARIDAIRAGAGQAGSWCMDLADVLVHAEQGPIIVTVHQPSDPRFDFARFVEALKARGVLICNFWTTPEPTIRIGAIGALTPEDMQRALAVFRECLAEALPAAA